MVLDPSERIHLHIFFYLHLIYICDLVVNISMYHMQTNYFENLSGHLLNNEVAICFQYN